MSDTKAIEFVAEVRQIRTMVDGSITVTLNIGEDCREQAKKFIDWHNLMVHGVMSVVQNEPEEDERTRGKPKKIHF